jgi:hypothetical protein
LVPTHAPTQRPCWDYKAYLGERVGRGHWSPVFRDHAQAVGLDAANLISHILAVGKLRGDPQGWVPASPRFIRDGINLDADTQDALLKSLQDQGIAEVATRGQPALRHVRIDTAALEQVVQRAQRAGGAAC